MAQIVLTNAEIIINSVNLSDRANQVTLNYEVEAVEVTAFGNTGRAFTGGLQNNTIDIEFHQDYAATETEATVFPLVGTTTTVVVKPTNGLDSATNPRYTITGTYLAAHTPVSGTVGELATTSLSFQGGTLVKSTGP
jgi:hypothetical protein